nr:hypothetical protein HK105_001255 [Polyrhizophydium stewartii]
MADRVLVPPLNFAMVEPGVYRSGYPNKKNFPFLKKLGLKSVMYICEDDYTDENLRFWDETGVRVFHVRVAGNKEPFGEIDEADIADALSKVLSVDNQPILLHCNKGKHRVGCLVGCLRKLQRWSLAAIFDEYRRFSGSKMHIADQEKLPAPSQGHPTEPQTATLPKPPEQQPDAASQPAATAAPFDKPAQSNCLGNTGKAIDSWSLGKRASAGQDQKRSLEETKQLLASLTKSLKQMNTLNQQSEQIEDRHLRLVKAELEAEREERMKIEKANADLHMQIGILQKRVLKEQEKTKMFPKVTSIANIHLRHQFQKGLENEREKYAALELENQRLVQQIRDISMANCEFLRMELDFALIAGIPETTQHANEVAFWRNKVKELEGDKEVLREKLSATERQLAKETKEKERIFKEMVTMRRLQMHLSNRLDSASGQSSLSSSTGVSQANIVPEFDDELTAGYLRSIGVSVKRDSEPDVEEDAHKDTMAEAIKRAKSATGQTKPATASSDASEAKDLVPENIPHPLVKPATTAHVASQGKARRSRQPSEDSIRAAKIQLEYDAYVTNKDDTHSRATSAADSPLQGKLALTLELPKLPESPAAEALPANVAAAPAAPAQPSGSLSVKLGRKK